MMNENTAITWQKMVSQTAQTTTIGGGGVSRSTSHPSAKPTAMGDGHGQDPKPTRILSHTALTVIVAFSILCLVFVDLLPTLSHTWYSFLTIGTLLMIAAVLAHIKR